MSEASGPALKSVSLDDKYRLRDGRVFMTGIQALVRLPIEQRWRDEEAGHRTAGYVSGYRGSPLGGYDQQLWYAATQLSEHDVVFNPGVNEELAATACWGTQQSAISGESRVDGVFAIWYGKGPGVDRSGDAFRHGNLAGSSPLGGVVCLLGDDHLCESSTTANHSEYAMVDASIPILNPAGVQEVLDYGLYAIAMSRFSGAWAALKCVHDTVEAAASVDVSRDRIAIALPQDYRPPQDGLHIRWPDTALEQEKRLYEHKLDAVRAFVRANALDRRALGDVGARLGIVTTGKSYLDVRQALDDLDIDDAAARRLGLSVYKVAVPFPLEPEGIREFCEGLEQVLVVEEKRALIETQLKDLLFGRSDAPSVHGKRGASGEILFAPSGQLDSNHIASTIGAQLVALTGDGHVAERTAERERLSNRRPEPVTDLERIAYFCPGCPHSSSTRVPEGSHALAGIGCHYLAQFMDRSTARFTQMGAEGASWVGEAPFSQRPHVFQNIGDGTYYHSGILAVRAAVAAKVNITFKILFNDAVAMTGGQSMDGPLTVPRITQQMMAEGARRVVVFSDEPDKYPSEAGFANDVTVHHRDDLDAVQRELRDIEGTTVLIYDQTCAAEKRRRRKRGRFPDPPKRLYIHHEVCEGCGDCGVASNCLAVVPMETALGRKRAIDQSACNKDYSCLKGFCPSFVTVHGGRVRRGQALEQPSGEQRPPLPEPQLPSLDRTYGLVVTGVGGTGVITIGALIGMAAHMEGKGCSILDQTGLAQKGGGVVTYLRIANRPQDITCTRIASGGADALIAGDMLVSATPDILAKMMLGRTRVVGNSRAIMPGPFTRDRDLEFPERSLRAALEAAVDADAATFLDATALATRLMGDAIATNVFLLGFAHQQGLVPVSAAAIERAIALNGVAVEMNLAAFDWGRRAAHDIDAVNALTRSAPQQVSLQSMDLDAVVSDRMRRLTEYQDEAYAKRYEQRVNAARDAEQTLGIARRGFADAVARNYFKLLAYKDEYEVARLFCAPEFRRGLEDAFEGDYRLEFNLAPPLVSRTDRATGRPRKMIFGPWMLRVFELLTRMKGIRGTWLDPFGHTRERRIERALIRDYEAMLDEVIPALSARNHVEAIALASQPDGVRGFGPVKLEAIRRMRAESSQLWQAFRAPQVPKAAA